MVDSERHQLHGALVNCQSPPMNCYVDPHEYLIKSHTSIMCRLEENDGHFFYDDKSCSFRFYFRRSFCAFESQCYSMTITCEDATSPTPLLMICRYSHENESKEVLGTFPAVIFVFGVIVCIVFCVLSCYRRCCVKERSTNIQKAEEAFEKLRSDMHEPIEEVCEKQQKRNQNNYVPMLQETHF
ncbi:Protein CBG04427 [Caenorhabditis briggsae]|uniref:Protein CBG04427 n=1 Tax=Caenorhabditis briggsae TaxID=6238 RepID=A8WXI6_CAEBR|nr:Protein CBG04427 [Caenorhabditis briggsae]CAP25127.2 Protein CBG04427 [Caenorhabditis briggsae]